MINKFWSKNDNQVVDEISQSLSYSFDNLFHWIACFIYLKAALVLPYLFNKNFYTDNEEIMQQYNQTNKRLKYLNWVNNALISLGFIEVIPTLVAPNKGAMFYLVSSIALELQLFFSCGAMVYALWRIKNSMSLMQNILPRKNLMITHVTLMVLIVVTALGFYIAQTIYLRNSCDALLTQSTFRICNVSANTLEAFNAAYTAVDAATYALILYMTFKFLVPPEKIAIAPS